jgi:UPF0755 protein
VKILRLLLLLIVTLGGYAAFSVFRPYANFGKETFVEIPRGTGTRGIARKLAQAGVIRHAWNLLVMRALHPRAALQAGEYRFSKPASAAEVFARIARGDIFYYELVVPEGRNMFDIAAQAGELGLFPAAKFLSVARNPDLIRDLDPRAPSLEGYLFPSTYRLTRHTTPEGLARLMTGHFRDVWRGLKSNADVHETVTLASLVEKEGKLPGERPLIASVFRRRLQLGMKLDCDPTTIYAALLDGHYRGAIYRSDLDSDNAYNTYTHAGLPPGPIGNPGLASIQAALAPAKTDYLYFVRKPDDSGGHTFSATIEAHEAATTAYRRANHKAEHKKAASSTFPGRKEARSR